MKTLTQNELRNIIVIGDNSDFQLYMGDSNLQSNQ